MIKEIFQDKDGNLSSKRVGGFLSFLLGALFNAFSLGDPSTNQVLIYAGMAAIGVTAFEKKTIGG